MKEANIIPRKNRSFHGMAEKLKNNYFSKIEKGQCFEIYWLSELDLGHSFENNILYDEIQVPAAYNKINIFMIHNTKASI